LFLVWYFFVKESDYSISFKVNAATGTVFQGIEEWSGARILMDNEKYVTLEKRNFDFIKQNMKSKNAEFEYEWDIKTMNDSIAKVTVAIKDLNHSLYNKLTVPFFNTSFKEEQIKKVKDLKEGLIKHIEKYKVRIEGEGESKEIFVAYLSLKSVLQEKAQKMIMTDADITGFLYSHKIEIIGKPFVEITNWNLDKETIDFNYCFPVDKNTKIIEDKVVKFKVLPAVKGLKATYYGNFRTSDRAWFRLLDYAKNHGYKLNNKPLENFLANPFNGGDELKWETKIIIPFDKK
jgi:effector-binding domain-containing protein